MRALAAFPKDKQVRLIERSDPEPVTGNQVLLRILEVGICGTDREIAAFHYGAAPAGSDYLILGHEALGEVVETGPEVTAVRTGELVVPTVRRPCPHRHCAPCRAHRQDFCITGDFTERGIKKAHGFLQEYVVEEDEYLVHAHRRLADVAVLTEPLSIAAKAAEQEAAIQQRLPWARPRVRGLVLGAGPVGLLGAMSMVVRHLDTFVYSLEAATDVRAKITRSMGATYVSGTEVPLRELAKRVFGTVNASRSAYETALSELEQGMFLFPEGVCSLITQRHELDDAPAAISARGGIKQVVHLADASRS